MLTLSFGFKKPQTNDRGPVVFPAMEANIQQLNDHTHNGANSSKLNTSSIEALSQTILAAAWVSVGGGRYRQLVTITGGMEFDKVIIDVRIASTGHKVYPGIEKFSATQFYVYTIDNTLDYFIAYG